MYVYVWVWQSMFIYAQKICLLIQKGSKKNFNFLFKCNFGTEILLFSLSFLLFWLLLLLSFCYCLLLFFFSFFVRFILSFWSRSYAIFPIQTPQSNCDCIYWQQRLKKKKKNSHMALTDIHWLHLTRVIIDFSFFSHILCGIFMFLIFSLLLLWFVPFFFGVDIFRNDKWITVISSWLSRKFFQELTMWLILLCFCCWYCWSFLIMIRVNNYCLLYIWMDKSLDEFLGGSVVSWLSGRENNRYQHCRPGG